MERKYNEMMMVKNGKLQYVITMEDRRENKSTDTAYIEIDNGEVRIGERWRSSFTSYNVGDETHKLAKETFTMHLRASIKEKINDLKMLEEIFLQLGQEDHFGKFIESEYIQEIKMLDYKH